jgi:hypothetical protein
MEPDIVLFVRWGVSEAPVPVVEVVATESVRRAEGVLLYMLCSCAGFWPLVVRICCWGLGGAGI